MGDYLAGTVVVRERIPVHGGPVAQMPPQLAYWAAGLELSGLPDDLALAVRQYLSRLGDLAPDVRDNLGRRLAAEVAERIGQPVPDGAPPWVFLSAVLSERRNRELARLTNSPAHPAVTRNGSEPPPRPPDSDGPFAAPR